MTENFDTPMFRESILDSEQRIDSFARTCKRLLAFGKEWQERESLASESMNSFCGELLQMSAGAPRVRFEKADLSKDDVLFTKTLHFFQGSAELTNVTLRVDKFLSQIQCVSCSLFEKCSPLKCRTVSFFR
jgi:hypothetical protein